MDFNQTMKELAEYIRLQDELEATIQQLKTELKDYMDNNNLVELNGTEHKASYKFVSQTRFDSSAFKKEMPELAQRYLVKSETKRFIFA